VTEGPQTRTLVLYDGLCGMCDGAVQWLLRHDRRGVLVFAPLQGETARPYAAAAAGVGERGIATMVLVETDAAGAEIVSTRSRAWLRIVRKLGLPWRMLSVVGVLPTALTDAVYGWVARNRTRWFGRLDACRVPGPAERARFLP
jgi:predicted DCC family thiol-disulfide oxidoreductase YuxK